MSTTRFPISSLRVKRGERRQSFRHLINDQITLRIREIGDDVVIDADEVADASLITEVLRGD